MRARLALALACLAMSAGCARSWIALDGGDLRRRHPTTLMVVVKHDGEFAFESTLAPPGLLAAAIIADVRGGGVLRTNHVVDPAIALGEDLAAELMDAYGLESIGPERDEDEDPREARVKAVPPPGSAELVLELRTTSWGVRPAPGRDKWLMDYARERYAVYYESEAKLIDVRDGTVLATAKCLGDDPRIIKARHARTLSEQYALTAFSPTHDQLLADGAALLKEQLDAAGYRCGQRYRAMLFP